MHNKHHAAFLGFRGVKGLHAAGRTGIARTWAAVKGMFIKGITAGNEKDFFMSIFPVF